MPNLKQQTPKSSLPSTGVLFGADSTSADSPSTYALTAVSPVLSVKAFGAKGDNSTDDTAAIQAALDVGGDIYIPDGTYILGTKSTVGSETAFLRIGNNTRLRGTRNAIFKLANNVGDYTGVIAPIVASGVLVENVSINGFTIDQNAANNSTCNITVGVTAKLLGAIVIVRQSKSVYVEDMNIINAPGVNTVLVNGPNTSDIRVNRNRIVFLYGTSTTTPFYDNSAIYINANGFQCNDNYVYNSTALGDGTYTGGASGIEVHGGNGQTCRNQVFRYSGAINVVGFSSGQGTTQLNNLVINENMSSDCRSGISVWSITGTGFKGFEICDNLLHLDPSKFASNAASIFGIVFIQGTGLNGDIASGNIFRNIIQFDGNIQGTAFASTSAGIQINNLGAVSDINVRFNTIFNAPNVGIRISQSSGAYDKIDVSDNVVRDAGLNTSATARFSILWSGVVTRSRCLNNLIFDTSATTPYATNGVATVYLSTGSTVVADRNTCQVGGTTPLRNRYGVTTTPPNTQALTFSTAASGSTLTLVPGPGTEMFIINYDVAAPATRSLSIETFQYPVPTGKKITIQLINTTGATTGNISFLSTFGVVTSPITLASGVRCQFEFTFDGATSKWYQSSPQVTVPS